MASAGAPVFDAIVAGGGAAGLSLAYRLNRAMPDATLLIVDEAVKDRNDHSWCFWHRDSSYLDPIAFRTWHRLAVATPQDTLTLDLAPYRYTMVRAVDFYRFMRQALGDRVNVQFQHGTVDTVAEGEDCAEVSVNALTYRGRWVFDSRYRPDGYGTAFSAPGSAPARRWHSLIQHFLGWEIETDAPAFDPGLPTLFDFRTPQLGEMRFFYVLPYTERRALVEYTLFSARLLPVGDYEAALRRYLGEVLGIQRYRIVEEERDLIPMTDRPFPRRAGRRVLNIGTRGGRVKASSGYAFDRIQRDAVAVTASLQAHGHPFALPPAPRRYRLFDEVLLDILEHHGELGAGIFARLFQRNPVQRVFRFLDEDAGWDENLALMATVPLVPFVRATTKVLAGGRWLLDS